MSTKHWKPLLTNVCRPRFWEHLKRFFHFSLNICIPSVKRRFEISWPLMVFGHFHFDCKNQCFFNIFQHQCKTKNWNWTKNPKVHRGNGFWCVFEQKPTIFYCLYEHLNRTMCLYDKRKWTKKHEIYYKNIKKSYIYIRVSNPQILL